MPQNRLHQTHHENRYDGATREELLEAYDQLYAVENAAKAERLRVVASMERRGLHTQDGQRSIRSWLQLHSGVTARTAGRWADVATKLDTLPHLAGCFAEGRISFDKLVICASFATPENDADVAREAVEGNLLKCEAKAQMQRQVSTDKEEHAHSSRSLDLHWADEGTRLVIKGSLPADEGAAVRSAIERIADSLPLEEASGTYAWASARRADALVALSRTEIADDQDPDRATVVVNVDLETLANGIGIGRETTGAIMSSEVMQRVACDARIQSIIRNDAGEIVGVGRTTRTAPPWLRRPMLERDGGCRFPGCGNKRFVHAHHIRWWTQGGPTDLQNLVSLCPGHHRLVHKKNWMVKGDPDHELVFVDPEGRSVRAGPPGLQPDIAKWLWDDLLGQDHGTSEEHRERNGTLEFADRRDQSLVFSVS